MKFTHFKAGQTVTCHGKVGVVDRVLPGKNELYPVRVKWAKFDEGFTLSGKKFSNSANPSLFVIDLPPYACEVRGRKTKTYWLWVNRKTGSTTRTYRDEKGFSPRGGHLVDAHAKYGSIIRWEDYRKMEWTAMELEDYRDY